MEKRGVGWRKAGGCCKKEGGGGGGIGKKSRLASVEENKLGFRKEQDFEKRRGDMEKTMEGMEKHTHKHAHTSRPEMIKL